MQNLRIQSERVMLALSCRSTAAVQMPGVILASSYHSQQLYERGQHCLMHDIIILFFS